MHEMLNITTYLCLHTLCYSVHFACSVRDGHIVTYNWESPGALHLDSTLVNVCQTNENDSQISKSIHEHDCGLDALHFSVNVSRELIVHVFISFTPEIARWPCCRWRPWRRPFKPWSTSIATIWVVAIASESPSRNPPSETGGTACTLVSSPTPPPPSLWSVERY